MVHDRQIEETRDRRKNKDAKRARSFDGGATENRLEIQESQESRKSFLIKFHTSSSMTLGNKGCKPYVTKGNRY